MVAVTLVGCGATAANDATQPTAGAQPTQATQSAQSATSTSESDGSMGGHDHATSGGPPPEGITKASDPRYEPGTTVILTADHMPGMKGNTATISGAFDTTTYSVSYTPVAGGDPVTDHKWVVHEELEDPGEAPLPKGTEVVLAAHHMTGMNGAKATIDSSTDETAYMVDFEIDGMAFINHKWVVESEIQPL